MEQSKMEIGVYLIKNEATGKVYVGSSSCLSKRLYEHRRLLRKGQHRNRHLQSAWNLDGEGSFRFEVVSRCSTVEESLAVEKDLILSMASHLPCNGYNVSTNPDNSKLGVKLTPEQRKAIGDSKRGNQYRLGAALPEDVKARISQKLKGRPLSDEVKRKMSVSRIGKPKSAEWVAKIQAARAKTFAAKKLGAMLQA
jgi:group I intron endonuclease